MKNKKKFIGNSDSYIVEYSDYGGKVKFEVTSATNHDLLCRGHFALDGNMEKLTLHFNTNDDYIQLDVLKVIQKEKKDWYYSIMTSRFFLELANAVSPV